MPSTHGCRELFTLSLDKITTKRGTSGELDERIGEGHFTALAIHSGTGMP
jgi:hypothetical protein